MYLLTYVYVMRHLLTIVTIISNTFGNAYSNKTYQSMFSSFAYVSGDNQVVGTVSRQVCRYGHVLKRSHATIVVFIHWQIYILMLPPRWLAIISKWRLVPNNTPVVVESWVISITKIFSKTVPVRTETKCNALIESCVADTLYATFIRHTRIII